MRKKIVLFVIGFCLLAVINSCQNAAKSTLKIGVNLPLTGTVSYYGTSARNGIELAKEELIKSGEFSTKSIEIIYEDNQGEGKQAVTAMSKLCNVDKVPAVIGGGSSTETMAAAPLAEQTKTVLISPISSASSISKLGAFIFRTCPSDIVQAQDLANWIKEQNYTNVAIIYVNSTWGTGFKDNFVEHFKSIGGNIISVIGTDPGESNFRTQAANAITLKPDAYVFIIYAKEGGTLVRQAKELGIQGPIFGADPWSQQDFRTGAGKYSEDIKYTSPAQFDGASFIQFRESYINKFNIEPDVYSSNGYDCMKLLAKIYLEGARTGSEFQQALEKVSDFQGATGITKFDGNGDVMGKKFGRFIIKNGNVEQLKN